MNPAELRRIVDTALAEDLGAVGDITTDAVFGADAVSAAVIVFREAGRVGGLDAVAATFGALDERVEVAPRVGEGTDIDMPGSAVVDISGPTRALLAGERVALNLLGRASGIATRTRDVVASIAGTGAAVADTRKTTPGLRALEKHAVAVGGGRNHRFGLHDAVMVKDNHIAAAGGIAAAVAAVRGSVGHMVTIEVEVDTLDQLEELLAVGADAVLLDNMDPDTLRRAVAMVDGAMTTEASGGITPENVRQVAETGVDVVSMGWLTHSVPVLDVAMEVAGR